jgi:tetratricopeptide (TPR) repeat protein
MLLYASVFDGPFVYDDTFYVRDNTMVQDAANIGAFWTTPYPATRPELGLYRPVTATTYLVDYLAYGLNPGGFHVSNAALHGSASALATLLVAGLGASTPAAAIAGVIFAVHPVHTEAVAWIVGRAEVLAGAGCFGAFLAWIRFRRTHSTLSLALAVGLYFLALGAKETAAPLPAAILLAEWLRLVPAAPDTAAGVRPRKRGWRTLLPYAGFALAFGVYVALRVHAISRFSMLEATTAFVGDPGNVRILSAIAVIGRYVLLCFLPIDLRVDYSDLKFDRLSDLPVLFGVAAILAAIGAGLALRRRAPWATVWIGWFLLFVLPFSNLIIQIGAVAAERFVYISSLGVCALAGVGLATGFAASRPRAVRGASAAVVAGLVLLLALGTAARNRDWQDPLRLFATEAERSPRSEKARLNLAAGLLEAAKQTGDQRTLMRAESVFLEGIALRRVSDSKVTGDHARLLDLYANYLQDHGRVAEAVPYYEKLSGFLKQNPGLLDNGPDFYVWFGAALEATGQIDKAVAQYEVARASKTGWIVPLRNIGQLLMKQGKLEEAAQIYREAITADPSFALGYVNLGVCLLRRSRTDEALAVLKSLEETVPDTAENAYYKGWLAQRLGRAPEAKRHYEHALALDPQRTDARDALRTMATANP